MASEIVELAGIISQSAGVLDQSLKKHGLCMPSFDVDSPVDIPHPSQATIDAQDKAMTACMELLDRLNGPLGCLCSRHSNSSLQVIFHFDVARHVPLDKEISYIDLSRACGVHHHDLKQVIRYAIAFHRFFAEKRKGYVSHSASSRRIVEDSLAHAGVAQFYEFTTSFSSLPDAISQFKGHEHHETVSFFQYISTRPDKAKLFSEAMKFFTGGNVDASPEFLSKGYPWRSLPMGAVVVDVGGSEGNMGRLISLENPLIQVIVEDIPSVIANAEAAAITGYSNVQFKAHDFFSPQPVVADVYLFRWVMHDWSDDNVVKILRQLIPALKNGAKVVVNESLCPENGSVPLATERYIRHIDMSMLALNNSRLRDVEEWNDLFQQADPRFGAVKCWNPPDAALAIMEVVWEGH
ncbi:S-adenosyl-L-methionine-dependent methyltransferase [Aspergillus ellipticus CBS 707.79]|uniref:S-adenosyl-L-methionine-dependent methyltransferase n=1 Tax=Aspergillus ellipticus CBS 707.79 TaxID=1448320 RepID=A0A319DMD0_9EURO|nr:S-adenosyl-L-methionine-dependent methyltransferase [Aspergillus ellipticus CBS 707.79]